MLQTAEQLAAVEEIRRLKARYFRGVDNNDPELVRSILAEDCFLDYRRCCTDPSSGEDFFPAMNIVIEGRDSWSSGGLGAMGIVSVHHSHDCEIELTGNDSAGAIWSMTDRLFMPADNPYSVMIGYGYYHETYQRTGEGWKLKTLRISRIRVESA